MSELPVLDAVDQRILGSLMEKQVTVPASYPLSANGLRTACNQTSNREPVVDYSAEHIERAMRSLKDRELARFVWSGSGQRTVKFHQRLTEQVAMDEAECAIVTVLLLRGPQAPGELKTRTERLHPFADRAEVEQCLAAMAQRDLVRQLPRKPGQQDHRWVHLFGPTDDAVETAPGAGPEVGALAADSESVLREGSAVRDSKIITTYDAVAAQYAQALVDELAMLPFERWLLERVAAHADGGPVVEVGCGPGHVTAYLAEQGADATGIDLSGAMISQARQRFPDGDYHVGDFRSLMRPTTAAGWKAVLGWYSLIHLAASEWDEALAALVRPLTPGGWLVLGVHAGSDVRHVDSWFGADVDLDGVLHDPQWVVRRVAAAGLVDVEWYLRGPLVARGEDTERLYVIGRRPA